MREMDIVHVNNEGKPRKYEPGSQEPAHEPSLFPKLGFNEWLIFTILAGVIAATAQPQCRRVMNELDVVVIEGVEGLTVRQAMERFLSDALHTPEGRKAKVKIAVASDGDDLEATVGTSFGLCTRFLLVDPDSLDYTVVAVTPKASAEDLSVEAIRTVAKGGATVVIAPQLQSRCCRVLFQLGMDVALCEPGISVRQAIELFKEGKLAAANQVSV